MLRYSRFCIVLFCILYFIAGNAEGLRIDEKYYEEVPDIARDAEYVENE